MASSATPSDPVIAAAGDIACPPGTAMSRSTCHHGPTSDLLADATAVLTLGDNQYPDGGLGEFQGSFDPTWGRFKGIMHPSVGNHEYHTPGAAGYYAYFGAAAGPPDRGYYSFDLGSWHLLALNSNCREIGGCGPGSEQERWLRADLAASAADCTLAFWHHPRFSSGRHGSDARMASIWQVLYDFGADVVLSGHDHNYQRFAPQNAEGAADQRGLTEFVVGTGGRSHYATGPRIENQEAQNGDTFGVLKVTLHPTSYDWEFVPEAGGTFTDSGSAECVHTATEDGPPVITSDGGEETAAVSVPEGMTAVTDVDATDPDDDPITYSISAGPDAFAFTIDAKSGVLAFAEAPDFELPADANGDNIYIVGVSASDGRGGADTQEISVTVTNSPELYFAIRDATNVGGVSVENDDIVSYDEDEAGSFAAVFDGSDVGLTGVRVDAFAWLDPDTLLLSFAGREAVPGIVGVVDDSDIVRFEATSLGPTTSGTFSLYFDGSDVGLSRWQDDIDAVETLPDGRIVISTTGALSVADVTARDEDLLVFTPNSLAEDTSGTLDVFFDGSDVGLGEKGEDVDAVAIDWAGRLHFSTRGTFEVPDLSGADEDVFAFAPTALGSTTAGSYSPTLFFVGSSFGLAETNVYAIDLP